jgi:alcohol dehydrogenase (cytochrome c)
MDPGQEKIDRNRGVALWGNLVISVTSRDARVIATDRDSGKMVWERNLRDQPDINLNAAPLELKDSILVGASGGDGAFYVTGSYDPATNVTYWGAGNPSPKYDTSYRPGDNLFTNSALALDAATGRIKWFHQYTPNETRSAPTS